MAVVTYTSAADKIKVFSAFIREGLEHGDWIIYLCPDEEYETVRTKLKEHGIKVEKHERDDTLCMKSLREFFMRDGSFDKDRAIQFFLDRRSKARQRGCKVREIEDVGDFSFVRGQWQKYLDYWTDPRWKALTGVGIVWEPFIMELIAINVEGMSEAQVGEILKAFGGGSAARAKFIDLLENVSLLSGSIDLDHERLVGRKILLEFDPVSDFEKLVESFAKEAMANLEPVFVFTSRTDPIYTILAKQPTIKFFLTSMSTSTPKSTSGNEVLLPAKNMPLILDALDKVLGTHADANVCFIFNILSELLTSTDLEKTYLFLHHALDMLSSEKTTCLFLLNTSAHTAAVVSGVRERFNNLLTYDKDGLKVVKLS